MKASIPSAVPALCARPKKKPTGEISRTVCKRIGFYAAALALACFFLFPFFVMICMSFLSDADVVQRVLFSPTGTVEIGNYFLTPGTDYMRYFCNSLLVSVLCAVGIPLVSSLCAYGFAKCKFHGRDVTFSIVLSTLMLPSVVTLIPLYAIFSRLHWINTLFPLWVPSLFGGGAMNIFLMRQFFRGIPDDIVSAAKIDGAGVFRIYWQFCLPLCVPVLLYVGYQSFVGNWNNFAGPMTYLDANSKYVTLALGLFHDYGPASNAYPNAAMAAGAVMTVPCLLLFVFFQKYLIEGVSVTGLKG